MRPYCHWQRGTGMTARRTHSGYFAGVGDMQPIPKDRPTPQCRTAYAPQVSAAFKKNRKQRFGTEYPSAHTGYALKVTMHFVMLFQGGLSILKGHSPEAVRFQHCSLVYPEECPRQQRRRRRVAREETTLTRRVKQKRRGQLTLVLCTSPIRVILLGVFG